MEEHVPLEGTNGHVVHLLLQRVYHEITSECPPDVVIDVYPPTLVVVVVAGRLHGVADLAVDGQVL